MLIIEIEKRHNKMVDRIRWDTVSYLPFYYVFFQFLLLTIFNLQANILTTKDILSNLALTYHHHPPPLNLPDSPPLPPLRIRQVRQKLEIFSSNLLRKARAADLWFRLGIVKRNRMGIMGRSWNTWIELEWRSVIEMRIREKSILTDNDR